MTNINTQQNELVIDIDVNKQQLALLNGDIVVSTYEISTAKNGVGQQNGSECTPLGWHSIRAKIGAQAKENTVFVARRNTGEIFTEALRQQQPDRDWILTRILWLSGLEQGKNRGGEVDTMRRYIYIHGCPDGDSFATPSSHGCVKMRNKDIIQLFDRVDAGTRVLIHEANSRSVKQENQ
ncbi:MAG: L,D-transpeptidase [Gammaproteobacteria bacterium]|nr:L,D-transpeptidase [Gammaproteobacteria bacterium]